MFKKFLMNFDREIKKIEELQTNHQFLLLLLLFKTFLEELYQRVFCEFGTSISNNCL